MIPNLNPAHPPRQIAKRTFKIVPQGSENVICQVPNVKPPSVRRPLLPNVAPHRLKAYPTPTYWLTIVKDDLSTHMFGPPPEKTGRTMKVGDVEIEKKTPDEFVLFVYQFACSSSPLVFIPISFERSVGSRYACLDCFRVYCLLKVKRCTTHSLPTFSATELTPDVDVRTWNHYCAGYDRQHPEIDYFDLYRSEFDPSISPPLPHLVAQIGSFLLKMGEMDRKLRSFVETHHVQSLQEIFNFLGTEPRLQQFSSAHQFLQLFKLSYLSVLRNQPSGSAGSSVAELLEQIEEEPVVDIQDALKDKKTFTYEELLDGFETSLDLDMLMVHRVLKKPVPRYIPYEKVFIDKNLDTCFAKPSTSLKPTGDFEKNKLNEKTTIEFVNNFVSNQRLEFGIEEFKAAVQRFRVLVLFYAPKKAKTFERIVNEVQTQMLSAATQHSMKPNVQVLDQTF